MSRTKKDSTADETSTIEAMTETILPHQCDCESLKVDIDEIKSMLLKIQTEMKTLTSKVEYLEPPQDKSETDAAINRRYVMGL